MQFIGYHGTSEASAQNILRLGVSEQFLPKTGQIGPGFYIAKMNGTLPQWGAIQATATAKAKQSYFIRMITKLTGGYLDNYLLSTSAQMTILKIYTTRPLNHCKWSIMNAINGSDFAVLKAIHDQAQQENYQEDRPFINQEQDAKWLQMVVPFDELQFLRAVRHDGQEEIAHNWISKDDLDRNLRPATATPARRNSIG